jgi:hypothetical protein
VKPWTVRASCDAADLEVCRAHVHALEQSRSNAIAACRVDDVIAADAQLLTARITAEMATAKATASTKALTPATETSHAAEAGVAAAARAAISAKMIIMAREFMTALDRAMEIGEQLEALSLNNGLHTPINCALPTIPAEVARALERLPRPHPLDVPLNLLRNPAHCDAYAKLFAELTADEPMIDLEALAA